MQKYVLASVLAAAFLDGCNKSDSTPPATPSMPTSSGVNVTVPATLPTAMTPPTMTTPTIATPAIPATPAMPSMPTAVPSDADAQAQTLIDKSRSAITSMNFSDAQKYVQQLDNMKSSLSPSMQTEVDQLDKLVKNNPASGLGGMLPH